MSGERHQDLVHRPPRRRLDTELPEREEVEHPVGVERKLAEAIRRIRNDDVALLALLQRLPEASRLTGRVVLIRELGAQRAGSLCSRAFARCRCRAVGRARRDDPGWCRDGLPDRARRQ